MTKDAVLLLSGGLDSAVCAYWARAVGYTIHALSVDYGQRHRRELDYAHRVAESVGAVTEHIVSAPVFPSSRLTGGNEDDCWVVPGRNLVLLSLAMAFALSTESDTILLGCNADDVAGFTDCRPPFLRAAEEVARTSTGSRVTVLAPLSGLTKAHVVQVGAMLGVPWHLTWSCYDPQGAGVPCGVCPACKQRESAFRDAGMSDLAAYCQPLAAGIAIGA